jgi:hypothetical protein
MALPQLEQDNPVLGVGVLEAVPPRSSWFSIQTS